MDLTFWQLALRIGAAVVLGGAVGFNREMHRRAAGFCTMILVCTGAAVFVLAQLLFASQDPHAARSTDAARVIQGLLAGIGFLGGGAILHDRGKAKGVTTAAALWVTTGIGVCCGLGQFGLAFLTAAVTLVVLFVLKPVERALFPHHKNGGDADEPDEDRDRDPRWSG